MTMIVTYFKAIYETNKQLVQNPKRAVEASSGSDHILNKLEQFQNPLWYGCFNSIEWKHKDLLLGAKYQHSS